LSYFKPTVISATLLAGFLLSGNVGAQILPREDQQTDAGLEDLYDKFETEETQKSERQKQLEQKRRAEEKQIAEKEISRVSELSTLAPFEDIAIIQRRFLPKTARFELSGSGLINTNNQYFNNIGLDLRAAFFFTEKYGIEANYMYISSSDRPITQGLKDNQLIQTKSLVQPEGFFGVAFKWSPIYGKVAWFQEKIIPFDLYFTPGFGMTQTANGGSESTLSLGFGQLFALSKSKAIRWDFNWHYYQTDVLVDNVATNRNQSDLFLSVGMSFFFPEASYR